jgi:hypothetical protein
LNDDLQVLEVASCFWNPSTTNSVSTTSKKQRAYLVPGDLMKRGFADGSEEAYPFRYMSIHVRLLVGAMNLLGSTATVS